MKQPDSHAISLSSGNSILEDSIQALKQILPAIPLSVNLSTEEWAAVRQLKSQKTLIINKSDKGGEVVVSDLDHYITEGLADYEIITLLLHSNQLTTN